MELWYGGDYAAKGGGVPDPVTAQMRVELLDELKSKGLTDKVMKEHDIKGSFAQMMDRLVELGMVKDRKVTTDRLRDTATKKLAARGKAAQGLDLSAITL